MRWALTPLLLAAALAAPPARAEVAVTPAPRKVVAGEARAVKVRLKAPGDGTWSVAVSEGTASPVVADENGEASFTWTLSADRRPRIAQVAAWKPGPMPEVGFSSVTLQGRATIAVQTEPGARVTVLVEGERFGPFQADDSGKADVTVVASPTSNSAKVEAVSKAGAQTTRPLDLGLPEFNHLFGVVLPTDAGAKAELAYVPASSAPRPSAIRVSGAPAKTAGPGRYAAWLELTTAGKVTAKVDGDAGSTVTMPFNPPRGYGERKATLTLEKADVKPGEKVDAELRVMGKPSATQGRFVVGDRVVPNVPWSDGRMRAELEIPRDAEPGRLEVAGELGDLTGRATLRVIAPPPAKLELGGGDRELPGDADSELELVLVAKAANGRTVPLEAVTATVDAPASVEAEREGEKWRLRVRANAVSAPTQVKVRVEAAGLRAEADVRLVPAPVAGARVPRRLYDLELGARSFLGAFGPELLGHAGWRLYELSPKVALTAGPAIGAHVGTALVSGQDVFVYELPVLAELGLVAHLAPFRLFAGAAAGADLAVVSKPGDWALVPALQFRAGTGFEAGPGAVTLGADIRAPLVDSGLGTQQLGGLGVFIGYHWGRR